MPKHLDFEITLRGVKPRIWRRFLLRSTASFEDLHLAIQDAADWLNAHMFAFSQRDGAHMEPITGSPDPDRSDLPGPDRIRLARFFTDDGPGRCLYEYDFGDSWEIDVVLRGTVEDKEKFQRRLIGGKRAFPPEDSGGIAGYERLVGYLKTGEDPWGDDPEDLADWIDDWQPDEFDLEAAKDEFDW